MAVEFRLPDLGEGITEGELLRWLVRPGDRVVLDQPVATVQTDKAVVELPSPVAGRVLTLAVGEGQVVPVHTLLLTLAESRTEAVPGAAADAAAPDAFAAPGQALAAAHAPPTHEDLREDQRTASGHAGPATTPAAVDGWTEASPAIRRRARATPAVRRQARERGIDINTVRGSGPAGRVLADDVRATDMPAAAAPSPKDATGTSTTGPMVMAPKDPEVVAEERLPLRGLRRRVAENMMLSVRTIPQVTALLEVDATALVALRHSLLREAEVRGVTLTYLPIIVKALVRALRAHPYINASIDDQASEIVIKHHYHIGIATATPDGLLVPVLRHADRLTVLQLAAELTRLAEAARARALPLEELRGSTFTISNYGAVGGFFATPIINPGEAAILGLGRIAERPWAVEGRVEARPVLPLSFTADHRLIDGDVAMRFLATLVAALENPGLLLLEMR